MIRKILFCLALALSVLTMRADGDWKLHSSLDGDYYQLFDTQDLLYILAYGQPYRASDKMYQNAKIQLFVHDKSSGETLGYNSRNYLSGKMISNGQYNPRGGYLCLVYTDGNMDLLYDNGKVVNIPALKNATLMDSKNVNSITFGMEDDNIYMTTDFGFVVIDPSERRIIKARNYHQRLLGIARVGNKLVLCDADKYYVSDYSKPMQSLSDFHQPTMSTNSTMLLPMNGTRLLAIMSNGVYILNVTEENELEQKQRVVNNISYPRYSSNRDGYVLSGAWALASIKYDGTDIHQGGYPTGITGNPPVATHNFTDFYMPEGRKGVQHFTSPKGIGWDAQWTPNGHLSRPNASAVFWGMTMAYSDKHGLLVNTPSRNRMFDTENVTLPSLVSALKNGEWEMHGYAYTNPTYQDVHALPTGITVDPNNPDMVYIGSRKEGLQVMNLSNPEEVYNIGAATSPAASLPGFIKVKEIGTSQVTPWYFNLAEPKFDGQGNLWCYHYTANDAHGEGDMWVWPASAIKNKDYKNCINFSTGQNSFVYGDVWPLKASVNRNLLLIDPNTYNGGLFLYDHNGTLENTSDDRMILLSSLTNQDGGAISYGYLHCMYEDENTGVVWIGTDNGIFTIQPSKMFDSKEARRIKVARNDGTNLADYLLDGIDVWYITVDGNGNKWFATNGAGVVQTSSDGTHVMRQLTSSNSYLPDDNTYRLCYNPSSNSMMIGTMDGLAEFFMPGSSTGVGFDNVKIYPNPVRPDFVGYITIEGLLDNSLVKIVDAEGNIVKELGSPMSGSVRWDGTNIYGAKVNSGIYFVFMSRSGENASESNVGKVMVVK